MQIKLLIWAILANISLTDTMENILSLSEDKMVISVIVPQLFHPLDAINQHQQPQISSPAPSHCIPLCHPNPNSSTSTTSQCSTDPQSPPGDCPMQSPTSTSTFDDATMAHSTQLPKHPNPYLKPSNLPNIQSKSHHSHHFMTERNYCLPQPTTHASLSPPAAPVPPSIAHCPVNYVLV